MYRIESDLLGEIQVPKNAYYGVQTQRAIENFHISGTTMSDYPEMIKAIANVKLAAAKANNKLGILDDKICDAIVQACQELLEGKYQDQFPVDMIQGGAGTSVNMNANEVIANRALEIMGYELSDYKHCSPNDHVNLSQSTNDAYPTTLTLTLFNMNKKFVAELANLVASFRKKGEEFADVIKMGRTQLQDAVPMSLGQEFEAFAVLLEKEIKQLNIAAEQFLEINMGGTAIGTGINAPKDFPKVCAEYLSELTNEKFYAAENLIAASPDTGGLVVYSSALKQVAVKLSKICNDLRLLSSGPRAGFHEINLPKMQPGSSIMPGKVNPVIPEVVNQVCFKVFGNDIAVIAAAEAGQLELNVMEPVIFHSILESVLFLQRAFETLRVKCIDGITANKEVCENMVLNSIGIVTAFNPHIGYKKSTAIAKEALATGKSVKSIALEQGLLSEAEIDAILDPKAMLEA